MGHQPERHHARAGLAGALALILFAPACGSPPTTPAPIPSNVVSLEISCPSSMLVGQTRFCFATALLANGSTRENQPADWSSSNQNVASIATVAGAGGLTGRGAGQVTVSATSDGKMATASVSVRAEDFLAVTAGGIQGTFQVGREVMMYVNGSYGVASADSGVLNIEIVNQNGVLVVAGTPRVVPKGGESFIVSTTFMIPAGTTKVCRMAVLQIGATRLAEMGVDGLSPCINVAQ